MIVTRRVRMCRTIEATRGWISKIPMRMEGSREGMCSAATPQERNAEKIVPCPKKAARNVRKREEFNQDQD